MKKYIIGLLLFIFINSCGFSQKTLRFNYYENGKKIKCLIVIPSEVNKIEKIKSDGGFSETRVIMKDSSIIYLTDNYESGSGIIEAKIDSYDENIFLKILTKEKIDIGGEYKKLYWREAKCSKVVCGYYNVCKDLKGDYDKIINEFIAKYCN